MSRVTKNEDSEVKTKARSRANSSTSAHSATVRSRKAPTPIATVAKSKNKKQFSFILLGVYFFLVGAVSVGVGYSDSGQIDVVATVNQRNEKINRGEVRDERTGEITTVNVPVQNTDNRPNGGLQQSVAPAETTALTPVVVPEDTLGTSTTIAESVSSSTSN
jgi:hypothetical protein